MSPERSPELFDSWAATYDYYISLASESFPFLGYDDVLSRIVELANPERGMKILDVGIGTGSLTQRFLDFDCEIWGIDYSSKMLEEARKKVPDVHLLQVDVRDPFPSELVVGFDRVVSAYTLHHLRLEGKVEVVQRMSNDLLRQRGKILIGDISFPTVKDRNTAHKKLQNMWDEDEYYWAADEFVPIMESRNFHVAYEQISKYGGIYNIFTQI